MKRINTVIVLVILSVMASKIFSQSINWASLKSNQRHIVHINAGWDYGLVFGTGYCYQLKTKMPVLLNISYSFPSGKNILDDFKTKIGGQFRIFRMDNIRFIGSLHGIYRRYQNPLVSMQNFGSEINGLAGYYRPKWFVAGEAGFDKAIVTHFKHSESFTANVYSGVKNGWYEPSTGGNLNFGLQAGYSFKSSDLTLKIGKAITQDFKTTPLIPYYFQLGYNLKIQSKNNPTNQ